MVGLIEKLGVERRLLHAGKSKARSDPFSPVKEEDQAKTKEILSDMHVLFESHVRASRGGKLAEERAEDIFSVRLAPPRKHEPWLRFAFLPLLLLHPLPLSLTPSLEPG